MKRRTPQLLILLFLWFFLPVRGETNIKFVVTGAMNVKGIMYVDCSMKTANATTTRDVVVVHEGTTALAGSFYHDALKNAFKTENDDWSTKTKPRKITSSTGVVKFVADNTGAKRYISTQITNYNRVSEYIAFPRLEIATNDQVYVPETMGLDARTLVRETDKNGVLYLASNPVGSDKIYDASFRVTGHKTGDETVYTVTAGSVVIEKQVKEFREATSGGAATILMPFAAPFTNMRSGYFAGNWVRHPLWDDEHGGVYYPYGNKKSTEGNFIDRAQYVIDPTQNLVATEPYLLRLQRDGAKEADEYGQLLITKDEVHDKAKFIFNGIPYPSLNEGIEKPQKQVFAGTPVLLRQPQTGISTTQNWLVGNSYTSALNGVAIATMLMEHPSIAFSTDFYIYPHGATAYQTHSMWEGSKVPTTIPDIQSMSVFMVCVWKGNTVSDQTITVGPEYQVHTGGIAAQVSGGGSGGGSEAPQQRSTAESNALNFVLTPESNPFIYDRTSIKLAQNARLEADDHDVVKMLNKGNSLFELYGSNGTTNVLQQNALPYDAEKALLSVNPASEEILCVLTAENAETFATEVVELYDTKVGAWHNLRDTNSYTFVLSPGDSPARFEVYFTQTAPTSINEFTTDWYAYNTKEELTIRNLDASLQGAQIRIHNVSGILMLQQTITNTPDQSFAIGQLPAGMYLISLEGKTIKFKK